MTERDDEVLVNLRGVQVIISDEIEELDSTAPKIVSPTIRTDQERRYQAVVSEEIEVAGDWQSGPTRSPHYAFKLMKVTYISPPYKFRWQAKRSAWEYLVNKARAEPNYG